MTLPSNDFEQAEWSVVIFWITNIGRHLPENEKHIWAACLWKHTTVESKFCAGQVATQDASRSEKSTQVAGNTAAVL